MATAEFAPGNYRFIPGVFQYSAGAAALPVPLATVAAPPPV